MAALEKRRLERVKYWQGQTLRARDFLNLQAVEAQRRWWHNRAVHNAYGVAEGLGIKTLPSLTPLISKFSKVTGLLISPGVAYDISGRELILERQQYVAVPALTPQASMSLLMRYKAPGRRMHPDEISEACFNAPGSVSAGTAEFVWIKGDRVDPAEGVAITAVLIREGMQLSLNPMYIQPVPRPVARPLLASGTTIPGSTPWNLWYVLLDEGPNSDLPPNLVGVETWIDTSAAGFKSVPCYFACLQGPLWNPQTRQLAPAILQSIGDESVNGFTFRLWLQVVPPRNVIEGLRESVAVPSPTFNWVNDPTEFLLFAKQQNLCVSWIGCQMQESTASCCSGGNAFTVVSEPRAS